MEFSQYDVNDLLHLSTGKLSHDRFTFYSPVYNSFKGQETGMCAWGWASSVRPNGLQTVADEDWYGRDEGHDGLAKVCDGEDFDEIYVTVAARAVCMGDQNIDVSHPHLRKGRRRRSGERRHGDGEDQESEEFEVIKFITSIPRRHACAWNHGAPYGTVESCMEP